MSQSSIANNANKPDAAVIAEIVQKYFGPHQIEVTTPAGDKAPILLLPEGLRAVDVKRFADEYRTTPEARTGVAELDDLDSFCEHAKRFADADSVLYARGNMPAAMLTAVIDYHRKGADGEARFGRHRSVYLFPLSEQWRAWTCSSVREMSQETFADFLHRRIGDVADPATAGESAKALIATLGGSFAAPSELLELSRGLAVNVGMKVQRTQNLATGEFQLIYARQHQDDSGAPLVVPSALLINVPIFQRGEPSQVVARLSYRVNEHAVVWSYELFGARTVFDQAFHEACQKAKEKTGLELFMGTPER